MSLEVPPQLGAGARGRSSMRFTPAQAFEFGSSSIQGSAVVALTPRVQPPRKLSPHRLPLPWPSRSGPAPFHNWRDAGLREVDGPGSGFCGLSLSQPSPDRSLSMTHLKLVAALAVVLFSMSAVASTVPSPLKNGCHKQVITRTGFEDTPTALQEALAETRARIAARGLRLLKVVPLPTTDSARQYRGRMRRGRDHHQIPVVDEPTELPPIQCSSEYLCQTAGQTLVGGAARVPLYIHQSIYGGPLCSLLSLNADNATVTQNADGTMVLDSTVFLYNPSFFAADFQISLSIGGTYLPYTYNETVPARGYAQYITDDGQINQLAGGSVEYWMSNVTPFTILKVSPQSHAIYGLYTPAA